MPPRKKPCRKPKQGPPVAFRPGAELAQMVTTFAKSRGVGEHEMYKHLAALAIVGLDVRHYDLLAALSANRLGVNPFVRAVQQLIMAFKVLVNVDQKYAFDPIRTRLLVDIVRHELQASGGLSDDLVQSVLSSIEPIPVNHGPYEDQEPEFHSTSYRNSVDEQQERVPIRMN